jgi:hypothetical protein
MDAVSLMRFEAVILVMVIIFCIAELHSLSQMGLTYFTNGWHYLSVLNYWLYFIGFIFRVTPFLEADQQGFPPPLGEYRNYEVRSLMVIALQPSTVLQVHVLG